MRDRRQYGICWAFARSSVIFLMSFWALVQTAQAQSIYDPTLLVATIERPPFSMEVDGEWTGFSVELMDQLAAARGADVEYMRFENFAAMLNAATSGAVDAAIANISITRDREAIMDFSLPIFESGLQIMIADGPSRVSLLNTLFNWDLLVVMLLSFSGLFVCGMLMWVFERRKQPYFDRKFGDSLFPSFWWALNLVVNGGFEERQPRSLPGRLFAVMLVVSSLFIVSIFVAHITAAMTVEAINSSVNSVNDLDGRRVGTTEGSTASSFLRNRNLPQQDYRSFGELMDAFEKGRIDAVVFDGPLLAYYLLTHRDSRGHLIAKIFQPENYGIAMRSGSPWREALNVELLDVNENGAYDKLRQKWFGQLP